MTKIIQSLFAEFIRKYMLPLIKLREEERVKYPSKVEHIREYPNVFLSHDHSRPQKAEKK
jgi:hypothetical protein